ncbi:uncharacterized protein PRCAT00002766001 [Priceomyces carsonii]|uniref:uncharacterized protein n=1 Tax=Priceomyces carsonii TaxID=28549 RepID=UPI002ED7CFE1|nr:unnamed protein product [Priceomyces carsonii]
MSLSNILQHVNKKGKIPSNRNRQDQENIGKEEESNAKGAQYTYRDGTARSVDPVVARLKEKRRLERAKKEEEERAKKGLPPKKIKTNTSRKLTASSSAGPTKKISHTVNRAPAQISPRLLPKPPSKKVNFNDLMKKASKIDNSKLSISLRQKSPESSQRPSPSSRRSPNVMPRRSPSVGVKKTAREVVKEPTKAKEHTKVSVPFPVREPSVALKAKLKLISKVSTKNGSRNAGRAAYSNHGVDDEDEDEDDGFIVSDEEEVGDTHLDYDRDEIWAMFNRGRKRSYYDRFDDYDSDDMEATGTEIFDEEMKSKRTAELEDRRELEEEKRLAALKKEKKLKALRNSST